MFRVQNRRPFFGTIIVRISSKFEHITDCISEVLCPIELAFHRAFLESVDPSTPLFSPWHEPHCLIIQFVAQRSPHRPPILNAFVRVCCLRWIPINGSFGQDSCQRDRVGTYHPFIYSKAPWSTSRKSLLFLVFQGKRSVLIICGYR